MIRKIKTDDDDELYELLDLIPDDERDEALERVVKNDRVARKCDCGAIKAKTTHALWCSSRKIK